MTRRLCTERVINSNINDTRVQNYCSVSFTREFIIIIIIIYYAEAAVQYTQ